MERVRKRARNRPSLRCERCEYEAPDGASQWEIHEQADPRMGNPLLVYECPECRETVDVRVLMGHGIG